MLELNAINHFSEEAVLPNGQRQRSILSYPKYYLDNGFLALGVEGFVRIAGGYEAKRGVHFYRVMDDGTFTYGHLKYSDRFIPIRQVTANAELVEAHIPMSPPSRVSLINDNEILHENVVPGVNRRFKYWSDGLYWRHEFTDKAQAEASKGSRFYGFEFRRERKGTFNGRLAPGYVEHEGFDELDEKKAGLRIPELRSMQGDIYRIGLNPQDVKDWVAGKVILNDSVTYQQGASGYSGFEDTFVRSSSADTNYGTDAELQIYGYYSGYRKVLWKADVSALAGETVDTAKLYLYCYNDDRSGGVCRIHKILNSDWTVGGATWNHAVTDTIAWNTAGMGSGTDYTAAQEDSWTYVGTDNIWHDWDIPAMVQDWIDGTNYGAMLTPPYETLNALTQYRSSDYTTDTTKRPKLTITYTPAAGGPTKTFSRFITA